MSIADEGQPVGVIRRSDGAETAIYCYRRREIVIVEHGPNASRVLVQRAGKIVGEVVVADTDDGPTVYTAAPAGATVETRAELQRIAALAAARAGDRGAVATLAAIIDLVGAPGEAGTA